MKLSPLTVSALYGRYCPHQGRLSLGVKFIVVVQPCGYVIISRENNNEGYRLCI